MTQGSLDDFHPDDEGNGTSTIDGRINRIIWPSGSKPPSLGFVQRTSVDGVQLNLPLTVLLGEHVRVQLGSEQRCTNCGSEASSNVCTDCSGSPPFTRCVMQPATQCTYTDCPFPEYKRRSCAHEFVVYLVAADGIKVGITKRTRTLVRWQEQGASHALPIATAPNRKAAGVIERAVSQCDDIDQRLSHEWYVPLPDATERLCNAALMARTRFPERLVSCFRWPDTPEPDDIRDDVVQVPSLGTSDLEHGVTSRRGQLSPGEVREGRVIGVRGALIATDEFIINTRRHAGHSITLETEAPFVESIHADDSAIEASSK